MKRYILAAIAVLVMMSGCEYHPYYDGQILRVYQAKYGLIEADGAHLNVPVADKSHMNWKYMAAKERTTGLPYRIRNS